MTGRGFKVGAAGWVLALGFGSQGQDEGGISGTRVMSDVGQVGHR